MFTGIVNRTGVIVSIQKKKKIHRHKVKLPPILSKMLTLGASIAYNGCCLTINNIDHFYIECDIVEETLNKTNLGFLNIGDRVNIERSVKYGDEIGGHIISGHIMNTVEVSKILESDDNYEMWFKIKNLSLMKYIFYKGFICIDGISLTVGKIINNEFCVHLIPETLLSTTIKNKQNGSLMNIEIDSYTQIIVDTTERLFKQTF
ncbi:riboflavin synthase subunit alpha [Buchnera aphidicola]|uniref:Riboflavin synthase n=1 Tax=Buchnera aphidicola (Artemisaphis artemisicola) TaxID=1241836 RepID=A0A4D6XI51_9GAMM|nr:riboflavin synthase subunit alpha [Buchnera aphidicola]QCI15803.1 riboflavin synthase subunit alpha [Buchnera aphidicola (Artemisaphis artemisicola)]